jgi:hypothetical protein
MDINSKVLVSGIHYYWPKNPTVLISIDGVDPEYLQQLLPCSSKEY